MTTHIYFTYDSSPFQNIFYLISSRPCSPSPWLTRGFASGAQCSSTLWAPTPACGRWTWAGTSWRTPGPRCSAKPCRSTQHSGVWAFVRRVLLADQRTPLEVLEDGWKNGVRERINMFGMVWGADIQRLLRGRTVSSTQRFKVNLVGDKKVRLRGWRDSVENRWKKGKQVWWPSGIQC